MKTEVIEVGNQVICDICDGDFTNDTESKGGFLFGSKAYCPKCAEERLPSIKSYNEEHYIKAYCPGDMLFRDFVLECRGGNNTIKIYSFDKGEKMDLKNLMKKGKKYA